MASLRQRLGLAGSPFQSEPAWLRPTSDALRDALVEAGSDPGVSKELLRAAHAMLLDASIAETVLALVDLVRTPDLAESERTSVMRYALPDGPAKDYLRRLAGQIEGRELALARIAGPWLPDWLEPLAVEHLLRLLEEGKRDPSLGSALQSRFPSLREDALDLFTVPLSDQERFQVMACYGPWQTARMDADDVGWLDGSGNVIVPSNASGKDVLKYFSRLESYRRALEPKRRRGRPPGTPRRTKRTQGAVSDQAALDAANAEISLPAWASKHAPDLDLSDRVQLHRARSRRNYARHRGKLLLDNP